MRAVPIALRFFCALGIITLVDAYAQRVRSLTISESKNQTFDASKSPAILTPRVQSSTERQSFDNLHSFENATRPSKQLTSYPKPFPFPVSGGNANPLTTTSDDASPPSNDKSSEDVRTIGKRRFPFIVASVTNATQVSAWQKSLGADGKWPESEVDYTSGCNAQRANWPAENHWKRIVTMAAAYHGSPKTDVDLVMSPDLRASISLAMDFWFSNDFTNIGCLDSGGTSKCPCNTPGLWNPNWFSNIIGIPTLVGQACLLFNDTLTDTQLSNCTNIGSRSYAAFDRNIHDLGTLTGANLLDVASIGVDLGLLTMNTSLISDAYDRVHNEVTVQSAVMADGIRPDGSFGQHQGLIYNGNYGKDYANDVLAFELEAANTEFQAGSVSMNAFSKLIDGDQWMIYRNVKSGTLHWDFSVVGRFISFPVADEQATGSIKMNITQLLVLGQEWNSAILTNVSQSLSTDSSNANVGSLNGMRVFYNNDYLVRRGNGYVSTLRMYSNRTKNSECTNSQNPFGFHLSDGTVYNYIIGNEYEDIAAAWDWNLIPGITVDYAATPLACKMVGTHGVESFVGGVSTGSVGIGAMRYTNPLTNALSWQKAWFFLDDDVQHVMVNSISSSTNAFVISVLDQRMLAGSVKVNQASVKEPANFTNPLSLWHGNVGYVFPNATTQGVSLSVDMGRRTGSWGAIGISRRPDADVDLFSAWLTHSNRSTSASYSVFPATDFDTFLQNSENSLIIEIQNDESASAIFDFVHKTAMVVFWPSSGGTITIPPSASGDAPVIIQSNAGLLIVLQEDTWTVSIADPSQTLTSVDVTFQLGSGNVPSGWTFGQSKVLSILLPSGGAAGSSVIALLDV